MRINFTIHDSKNVRNANIKHQLQKANLREIVNNLEYLSNNEQSLILK